MPKLLSCHCTFHPPPRSPHIILFSFLDSSAHVPIPSIAVLVLVPVLVCVFHPQFSEFNFTPFPVINFPFFCFPLLKYVCRPPFPIKELSDINHFIILHLNFNFSSFDSPPYFPFHYILIFIFIVCTFRNPYLSLFVPVSIAYESLAVCWGRNLFEVQFASFLVVD